MLDELIPSAFESGAINQCDPNVNPENFPGDMVRNGLHVVGLSDLDIDPDKAFLASRNGGLFQRNTLIMAMFNKHLAAANMAELVAYAAAHPDWTESRSVVALGQTWENPENVREAEHGWHDIRIPTVFCGVLRYWARSGRLELGLTDADALWTDRVKYLVVPAYKGEK